jgi:hypothetical protein
MEQSPLSPRTLRILAIVSAAGAWLVGFPLWVNVVFTISSLVVFANADRIGTKPTLEPRFALYVEALSSPNPNHRAQAAGVLGQMQNIRRSQRPLLISHLEPLLRDPDTLYFTRL